MTRVLSHLLALAVPFFFFVACKYDGIMTVSLHQPNGAPKAENVTLTLAEDTAISIHLEVGDPDGDPLSMGIESPPKQGALSGTPPQRCKKACVATLTYKPNSNFNGDDNFVYFVSDRDSKTSAKVTLKVLPVNDAPITHPASIELNEDTLHKITLVATDVDADPLTYILVSSPAHGKLTGSGPNLTYTPFKDINGEDGFQFKINDGSVDSNISLVKLRIKPINDAPIVSDSSLTTLMNTPASDSLSASDVDSQNLTFSVVQNATKGVVTITEPASGSFTYVPFADYSGSDSFTFKANDGQSDSNTARVALKVVSVNKAPIAYPASIDLDEDTPKAITLQATDVNADPLTYTLVSYPVHGKLTGSGPNLTYTPIKDFNGEDSFSFKANDGTVDSNVSLVKLRINPINDAPIVSDSSLKTLMNTPLPGTLNATDVDSSNFTFSVVQNATKGVVTITDPALGSFTYVPNTDYSGSDSFTFKANDGQLDSNTAKVSLIVVGTETQIFTSTRKKDFLLVMDKSGSMSAQIDLVKQNVYKFFEDTLQRFGIVDYQVAVTVLNLNPVTGDLLSSGGIDIVNSQTTPDPTKVLVDIMNKIPKGVSQEQGLLAAKLAIDKQGSRWMREGAEQAFLFLTDEQDNSGANGDTDGKGATPVSDYINYFNSLPVVPLLYPIIGHPNYPCDEVKEFGTRYIEVQQGVGTGQSLSVCNADILNSFLSVAETISKRFCTKLGKPATGNCITVKINSENVPMSESNGYTFEKPTNSICFHGNYVLKDGDRVDITYEVASK